MVSKGTVIVTGGAKRVGRDICLYLAEQGYDIALHYNASSSAAEEVKQSILQKGVSCETFQLDLSDSSRFEPFIKSIKSSFPNTLALVNNASVYKPGDFWNATGEIFDEHFDINVKAPFFLTRAFASIIGKGSVINIIDTNITRHRHTYFPYLLSKKSFNDLTLMCASLLAPKVRVNAVCPGTMLPDEFFKEEQMKKLEEKLPMQKLPTTGEVAAAICLFIENQFLTGQTIYVDGGQQLI